MTSWTDPKTWITGELVDAATLNTHLRDNLLYLKNRGAFSYAQQTANYSLAVAGEGVTTGWVNVDTANLSVTHNAEGGLLLVGASFTASGSRYSLGTVHFDIEMDGVRLGGTNGLLIADYTPAEGLYTKYRFWEFLPGIAAGSHTFRLQWKLDSIHIGSWTGDIYDITPTQFYVKEFAQ